MDGIYLGRYLIICAAVFVIVSAVFVGVRFIHFVPSVSYPTRIFIAQLYHKSDTSQKLKIKDGLFYVYKSVMYS